VSSIPQRAAVCAALVWVGVLIGAPLVAAQRDAAPMWARRAVAAVYAGSGLVCHQRAARSFHLAGVQQPVCARCFGLYASGALGLLVSMRRRRPWPLGAGATRAALILAASPTVVTVALDAARIASVTAPQRAIASLPLGAAVGALLAQATARQPASPAESR
jgi:uncharacterized membrane protein